MMIPITRKEKYINEIVGGGNTAPETPQTREELFYAAILGEVVAPSPITRVEKYLSAIAGQYNGELPEPVTRIERFIARAAGMDVIIPTPITREEMLWAKYALITERELNGMPPLTFNSIAGTLKNYRIYGNTVNGESVGDRTGNLFDGTFIHRSVIGYTVGDDDPNRRSIVVDISNFNNGNKITFSRETGVGSTFQMYQVSSPLKGGNLLNTNIFSGNSETLLATITLDNISNYPYLMIFLNGATKPITDEELLASKIMVNVGNTPLPYEPYGYKVPVTVSNGTDTQATAIYLDAPLEKSGNNADYIDYATQKRRNSDGTESSVTLPEIAVTAGTNTLTVGTEVQPSNVYIKYEGAR